MPDTFTVSFFGHRQLGSAFRVEAELEKGITVRGNEALLRNALDNLLMNGLLYSPPGERLRVVLRQGCLRVENTGVTLPEEALPHLFEPFYRVEGSRSRASGGSGLGLFSAFSTAS